MKRTEAQQIGDIIHEVFVRTGNEGNEARQRACAMWGDIVGVNINRRTTRRYVSAEGVMHVYLNSAPLKADLQFAREKLIEKLNEYSGTPGSITDLIIH